MNDNIALETLDYLLFLGYFVLLSGIGYWFGRRPKNDAEDYFLAGRSLPWYVVGASYIAANISTEHFIGMIGAAVVYGICVATPEWSSVIAFSFLIWIFIPFLLKAKVFTIPQFLEKRFNTPMRVFFAIITVIANITAFLAPVIYGGGLILERVMGLETLFAGNLGLYLSIAIIGLAAGIWAIWGGLQSVAWMDLLTITVMIIGGLSVTLIGLDALSGTAGGVGEGLRIMLERNEATEGIWQRAMANVQPHIIKAEAYNRLSVIQPLTHETTPWSHWMLSFFYIGLWYTVINQFMIQRVLAAKDQYHAQMGINLASFLKLLLPFIVVVPGLIYFALHPEILLGDSMERIRQDADKTYVNMIRELIPVGLRGILLAALFGAIQSTVSAVLTSTSTILTLDFWQHYQRSAATQRQTVVAGRWITALVLGVSILLGVWISTLGQSLFVYIQELFTFFAPPFSAVFLLGAFWKRINGKAAFITTVFGLLLGLLIKLWVNMEASTTPDWLSPYANQGVVNWALCMLLAVVISLSTAPPRPEQISDELMFNWQSLLQKARDGHPWYQSVSFWWGLSVLLLFVLIIIFSLFF